MSINVRSVFLLLFILAFVVISLPFILNRFTQSENPGCRALTDTGEINPLETLGFWQNRPITPLLSYSETISAGEKHVLGLSAGEKWIEVDLSDQKLTAHEGESVVLSSPISSGLWYKTPIGEYRIWYKIKSTKMEGGSKLNNTYYYLPNVPFDMFFYGDYGIHGTYWHSNFGRPMSHGCVNTPTPVAERLFYWTDPQMPDGKNAVKASTDHPGTRVVIHE